MRQLVLAAALAAALTGCGGGGGGGGEPTRTPASVAVTAAGTTPLASIGDTRGLTAVVRDGAGAVIPNASVSWSATPAGIVTLSGTSGLTVTTTAAGNGTATIVATSGPATGQTTVDVAQRLSAVKVNPASVSVAPGSTRQLAATAADARDNAIAGATGFTFESSNDAVATVGTTGLVTGVADGTATITVRLTRDGVNASTPVAVTVAPVAASASVDATTGDTFSPTSVDIAVGGQVTWTFAKLHNVTFTSASAPADIGNTASGSVSRTFPTAGSFPYTCTLHPGMNATVVVH
ncbi:MAG: Ig-like domain-containing protein [Gemmatimonadaceae bacterium]